MTDTPQLELDASELTPPEWFFLITAFGLRPGADLTAISEYHRVALGKSRKDQMDLVRTGMESLLARGFIRHAKNAQGMPQYDAAGQPVYEGVGRIVRRVRAVNPADLMKTN